MPRFKVYTEGFYIVDCEDLDEALCYGLNGHLYEELEPVHAEEIDEDEMFI